MFDGKNALSTGTESNFYCNLVKMCTRQFLGFSSGRSLHWIFENSAPVPLGHFFLEATALKSAKTEKAHISTGKVVWRHLSPL